MKKLLQRWLGIQELSDKVYLVDKHDRELTEDYANHLVDYHNVRFSEPETVDYRLEANYKPGDIIEPTSSYEGLDTIVDDSIETITIDQVTISDYPKPIVKGYDATLRRPPRG